MAERKQNNTVQCQNVCCAVQPSVCQNLDELDFEKGLWQAAIDDNVERIRYLINNRNIPVDLHDSYGYTALHYATRNGKIDAAKYLIESGADINARTKNNGATPLHRATSANQKEMVQFLIQHGADTKIRDFDELTPLDRAIKENNSEMIKLLHHKI